MFVVKKRPTNSRNAPHEQRLHNQTYLNSMIARVGDMPIVNVIHSPSSFKEQSRMHNRKMQMALRKAERNSRRSKHNTEVERARLRSVLESRIGGNAPYVIINRVYPLIHYPGSVIINRRSNIRRPNNINRPNTKRSNNKSMPPRIKVLSSDTVISTI